MRPMGSGRPSSLQVRYLLQLLAIDSLLDT